MLAHGLSEGFFAVNRNSGGRYCGYPQVECVPCFGCAAVNERSKRRTDEGVYHYYF